MVSDPATRRAGTLPRLRLRRADRTRLVQASFLNTGPRQRHTVDVSRLARSAEDRAAEHRPGLRNEIGKNDHREEADHRTGDDRGDMFVLTTNRSRELVQSDGLAPEERRDKEDCPSEPG